MVAKLTMGALAWGDVWFGGKTRNPWDVTKGSSGSSAGPGSAVSAGLVPFAIGTETWGSIVSPSTVCGVTGLRPTYGRVSRMGAMALSWSMDKIGPICRNAEDLVIVFEVIKGVDGLDPTLYDLPFNYTNQTDLRKLRVGYLKTDFDKNYAFHKNDSLTLAKLVELGAELIPVELPDIDVNSISFILSVEAAAAFDELTRSNKDDLLVRQIKEAWPNEFRSARFIPAVEYINANRIRTILINEMKKLFNKVDLYVAPSWEGDNLLLTNLTGLPCVVLPNGFSEEGTPTSITFIGKLFDEGTIISVAKKFQDATEYHKKRPILD
jgi:Asp-tRNA(Asn)/Glu-tRNA(Gln) amidotransferase A subunit family amidase